MKCLLCSAFAALLSAEMSAFGVTVTVDKVQQRYPWNGLVDIDYTIACQDGEAPGVDDDLEVVVIDNAVSPAVTNRAVNFLQAPLPLTAGSHRVTWDANADGVTLRTDQAEVHVSLVHYAEAYMVIDVSGGPSAKVYPVDFLNGVPPGGFNLDEYKGDKIVLRYIHPGTYLAGSPSTEANRTAGSEGQNPIALTQPFYIGVFEITQKQYLNVMGGVNPATALGDFRPVERMPYNTIRGTANTTTHLYDWPWTNEVATTSFMGNLRAKCKSKDSGGDYTVPVTGFDLPTDYQWEYACRAGTTGAFNTTNEFANSTAGQTAAMAKLGRYGGNTTDGRGGDTAEHVIVGSYEPNAWGLYDMHGNVSEWCLDWYRDNPGIGRQHADPKGPEVLPSPLRVFRGGSWRASAASGCRSAKRDGKIPTAADSGVGFRLVRVLP